MADKLRFSHGVAAWGETTKATVSSCTKEEESGLRSETQHGGLTPSRSPFPATEHVLNN